MKNINIDRSEVRWRLIPRMPYPRIKVNTYLNRRGIASLYPPHMFSNPIKDTEKRYLVIDPRLRKPTSFVFNRRARKRALKKYRKIRENGKKLDQPGRKFPKDGRFEVNNDLKKLKVSYVAGNNDQQWMDEKDKNYLTRLERSGQLDRKEPRLRENYPAVFERVIDPLREQAEENRIRQEREAQERAERERIDRERRDREERFRRAEEERNRQIREREERERQEREAKERKIREEQQRVETLARDTEEYSKHITENCTAPGVYLKLANNLISYGDNFENQHKREESYRKAILILQFVKENLMVISDLDQRINSTKEKLNNFYRSWAIELIDAYKTDDLEEIQKVRDKNIKFLSFDLIDEYLQLHNMLVQKHPLDVRLDLWAAKDHFYLGGYADDYSEKVRYFKQARSIIKRILMLDGDHQESIELLQKVDEQLKYLQSSEVLQKEKIRKNMLKEKKLKQKIHSKEVEKKLKMATAIRGSRQQQTYAVLTINNDERESKIRERLKMLQDELVGARLNQKELNERVVGQSQLLVNLKQKRDQEKILHNQARSDKSEGLEKLRKGYSEKLQAINELKNNQALFAMKIQEKETELHSKQQQIEHLQEQSSKDRFELTDLKKKIQARKDNIFSKETTLIVLRENIKENEQTKNHYAEYVNEAKSKYLEKKRKNDRIQSRLRTIERRKDRKESKLWEKKSELSDKKSKRRNVTSQIQERRNRRRSNINTGMTKEELRKARENDSRMRWQMKCALRDPRVNKGKVLNDICQFEDYVLREEKNKRGNNPRVVANQKNRMDRAFFRLTTYKRSWNDPGDDQDYDMQADLEANDVLEDGYDETTLQDEIDNEPEIHELDESMDEINAECYQIQQEISVIDAEIDEVEEELDKAEEEAAEAEAEYNECQTPYDNAENEIQQSSREYDDIERFIENENTEIEQDEEYCEETETALVEEERELENLENEIPTMKNELEVDQANLVDIETDLSNKIEQLHTVKSELEQAEFECDEDLEGSEEPDDTFHEMDEQIDNAKLEYDQTVFDQEQAGTEITELENEIRDLKQALAESDETEETEEEFHQLDDDKRVTSQTSEPETNLPSYDETEEALKTTKTDTEFEKPFDHQGEISAVNDGEKSSIGVTAITVNEHDATGSSVINSSDVMEGSVLEVDQVDEVQSDKDLLAKNDALIKAQLERDEAEEQTRLEKEKIEEEEADRIAQKISDRVDKEVSEKFDEKLDDKKAEIVSRLSKEADQLFEKNRVSENLDTTTHEEQESKNKLLNTLKDGLDNLGHKTEDVIDNVNEGVQGFVDKITEPFATQDDNASKVAEDSPCVLDKIENFVGDTVKESLQDTKAGELLDKFGVFSESNNHEENNNSENYTPSEKIEQGLDDFKDTLKDGVEEALGDIKDAFMGKKDPYDDSREFMRDDYRDAHEELTQTTYDAIQEGGMQIVNQFGRH